MELYIIKKGAPIQAGTITASPTNLDVDGAAHVNVLHLLSPQLLRERSLRVDSTTLLANLADQLKKRDARIAMLEKRLARLESHLQ